MLIWQGHADKTLDLLSVAPPPELKHTEFEVLGTDLQGSALSIQHHFYDADAHLQDAEKLASSISPHMLCQILLDQGTSALRQKQYQKAEQLYRQALSLAQEHKNTFVEASALGSMGLFSTRTKHFDNAIDWLTRSLTLSRAHGYRMIETISIDNLVWTYEELGDFEKAIEEARKEEQAVDSIGQLQLKANMYNKMGFAYFAKHDYADSRMNYQIALKLEDDLRQKDHASEEHDMAIALSNIAAMAIEEGRLQEGEDNNSRAQKMDSNEPNIHLNDARIHLANNDLEGAKPLLLEAASGTTNSDSVRWQAKAELANLYALERDDKLAEKQYREVIDEFDAVRDSIQDTENKLAFTFRAERFYDKYISSLVEGGHIEAALQVAEFSRARTLAERVKIKAPKYPADIAISSIRHSLTQQNKTVFAYWLSPNTSYLWVIPPVGKIELSNLKGEKEIEDSVRDYQGMIQRIDDEEALDRKASDLYDKLVKPGEKFIHKNSEVIIVPDGALFALNFETLRVSGTNPHNWIEDVEVQNASSIVLLAKNRGIVPSSNQRLLMIGDPVEASSEYPALRHAAEELEAVKKQVSGQEAVFSKQAAVPSVYSASHPEQFDFVDFVTHGTASETSPLESAIILSPEGDNSFKLYARDIVNIPIHANVVTISACYGAGKRTYSREGLVGLAWAFLAAGAHQVVAGLWEVDDQVTPRLMNDFYHGLREKQSAAKSLRAAKLALLHSNSSHKHPFYWASLQLYAGS